jgi:hypothetical protein
VPWSASPVGPLLPRSISRELLSFNLLLAQVTSKSRLHPENAGEDAGGHYSSASEASDGLQRLLKQFSFPGRIGSHRTPETPGSIREGGALLAAIKPLGIVATESRFRRRAAEGEAA